MAQKIKLFEKNKIDYQNENITITVTDSVATDNGQAIVDYIRNRNNNSSWVTTESTDAAGTYLEIDMADTEAIDTIILVGHNFKNFTIYYWNGGSYTAIQAYTNSIAYTTQCTFTEVQTSKIKILISSCQTTDDDKFLKQLIVTKLVRQLAAYPEISKPTHETYRSIGKMLSGKSNFVSQIGGFSVDLKLGYWNNDDDLLCLEKLFFNRLPMLLWLCGGDEDQFKFKRVGYRLEDLYLVRPSNDYVPQWFSNVYSTGLDISIKLVESVD